MVKRHSRLDRTILALHIRAYVPTLDFEAFVTQPQQPAPPAPPAAPAAATPRPGQVVIEGIPTSPSAVYQGLVEQRRELRDQLEGLEDRRGELAGRLEDPSVVGADRTGIETRITELDRRITDVDRQIADVDAQVARSAAIPGAVVPPPPVINSGPPEEAIVVATVFTMIIALVFALAWARRIWKRGAALPPAMTPEMSDRFTRLEQALETVAVEVERIGEGQRFVTRLFSEGGGRAIGSGAAEPIEVRQRDAIAHPRGP